MNAFDDFECYIVVMYTSGVSISTCRHSPLKSVYKEMNGMLRGGFEWALYSIEHVDSAEILMNGRMTPEAWTVYGDSWHAFQTFLEYFSPDFDERVNAAMCGHEVIQALTMSKKVC